MIVEERETDDPLAAIESSLGRYRVPNLPGLPRSFGGLVGYRGYDSSRYVEKRLANGVPPDDMGKPDIRSSCPRTWWCSTTSPAA